MYEKNHAENVHKKLIPDPFLVLVNNPKQPLDARNFVTNPIFWKRICKKVNFIFLSNRMSSVCHSYVISMSLVLLVCHPYITRMCSYDIRMALACTRISSVCLSYVLVCQSSVVLPWTELGVEISCTFKVKESTKKAIWANKLKRINNF